MDRPARLEDVVAGNVARLRQAESLTQEQLARLLRLHGLPWDRSTVAGVETQGRQVRLTEAVALCAALSVSMTDLVVPAAGDVTIDEGTWSAGYLRAVIEGDEDYSGAEYTSPEQKASNRFAVSVMETESRRRQAVVENLRARWDLDPKVTRGRMKSILGDDDPMDKAVAERIGKRTQLYVTPGDVKLAAERVWGRSVLEERDRRVAERPGNVQAVRGRVTRELESELEQVIEEAATRAAAKLGQLIEED
jgi:transcriptional regulator with XRE-family HTH domain